MGFWKRLFGTTPGKEPSPKAASPATSAGSASVASQPSSNPVGQTTPYKSSQWGFTIDYPTSWQIVKENVKLGELRAAVIIAGPQTKAGGVRPNVFVSVVEGPVTAAAASGGGGGWMKVRTMDSSGHLVDVSQTPGLPRNAQEFIEQLKRQIKRDNSDSKLESAGEVQLAGASGVRVCYTSGSTRVLKVTRFGSITTFQFACEAPAAAWSEVEPTFNRMIESFTLA